MSKYKRLLAFENMVDLLGIKLLKPLIQSLKPYQKSNPAVILALRLLWLITALMIAGLFRLVVVITSQVRNFIQKCFSVSQP